MPKYAIYTCSTELPKWNYGRRAEGSCCRRWKAEQICKEKERSVQREKTSEQRCRISWEHLFLTEIREILGSEGLDWHETIQMSTDFFLADMINGAEDGWKEEDCEFMLETWGRQHTTSGREKRMHEGSLTTSAESLSFQPKDFLAFSVVRELSSLRQF